MTLRIDEKGLPIHKDATLKIRPRIFLEGNFFVDLSPGSPSAPELGDGDTIPINQTAGPVQLDQVLGTLQADTRKDLQVLLDELDTGVTERRREAINRSIPYWEPAYNGSAIVNDATLGLREHDLSGYIARRGAASPRALDRNARAAQVADHRPAHDRRRVRRARRRSCATRSASCRARCAPASPRSPRSTTRCRRCAASPPTCGPACARRGPALDAQVPFVRQLRGLVQPRASCAAWPPTCARPSRRWPSSTRRRSRCSSRSARRRAARTRSSCRGRTTRSRTGRSRRSGPVYQEPTKPLVGLAGESRTFDANGQWFRVALNAAQYATPVGNGQLHAHRPPAARRQPAASPPSARRCGPTCRARRRRSPTCAPDPAAPRHELQGPQAPAAAEAAARAKAVDVAQGRGQTTLGPGPARSPTSR